MQTLFTTEAVHHTSMVLAVTCVHSADEERSMGEPCLSQMPVTVVVPCSAVAARYEGVNESRQRETDDSGCRPFSRVLGPHSRT